MKHARIAVIVMLGSLFICASARGEGGGFQLPDLNPFDGPSKSRTPKSSSSWTLPSMPKMALPKMGTTPKRRTTPTTWQRMQRNTGDFFSSLNPWAKAPPRKRTRAKSSGSSAFSWLFPEEKKEKKIRDVNDFLSLPRPDYD